MIDLEWRSTAWVTDPFSSPKRIGLGL